MPNVQAQIEITVTFYSFFKDLAGCTGCTERVLEGSTLHDLLVSVVARFPKLEPIHKSALTAVGVEYQDRSYILRPGDEVSLFPPVQGG